MRKFLAIAFMAVVVWVGYNLMNGGLNFAFDLRVSYNSQYNQLDDVNGNVQQVKYWK